MMARPNRSLRPAGQRVAELKNRRIDAKKKNKTFKSLSRYVTAIENWEDGGRDWLDHWAYLCGQFPPCQDVYIDGVHVNLRGNQLMASEIARVLQPHIRAHPSFVVR